MRIKVILCIAIIIIFVTGIIICIRLIVNEFSPAKEVAIKLQTLAHIEPGKYPRESMISGILWHSEFTSLHLSLSNITGEDFRDVDVILEPDVSIAAISQVSSLQGVSLIGDATKEQIEIDGNFLNMPFAHIKETGENIHLAQVLTPQYRIRCQLIPKHSDVQLLLAVSEIDQKPGTTIYASLVIEDKITKKKKFVIFVPKVDLNRVIYIKKIPIKIRVYGTYNVKSESKKIDEVIDIKQLD